HERGVPWVLQHGRQAFDVAGVRRFWGGLISEAVGGGKGLSDRLFELAERAGVAVRYETKARSLRVDATGRIIGVIAPTPSGMEQIDAGAVILACGGFEANKEMRTRYLGADWELAKVRGTRFNTGDAIKAALDIGAQPYGHWSCCHAVAWDYLADDVGDLRMGDLHQKHSYPIGIIVNRDGKRFVDEGADYRNYTY